MASVLIVGGAGYVGSALCAWLRDHPESNGSPHRLIVLDDLSTGHRDFALGDVFVQGRAGDKETLGKLFKAEKIDCVMHFAAKSLVGESVQKPKEYFENNVFQTQGLLEAMLEHGVRKFIFSSTCAVFGDPQGAPMLEDLPKNPLSPYGETKLAVEKMLQEMAVSRGLQSVVFRYFNAAGAEPKLRVGEWHEPETHLIPRLIHAVLDGQSAEVFGTDYPTPDGTCVRDYVHVWDLAQAHASGMRKLLEMGPATPGYFRDYNLGSEEGYSVREILGATQSITGKKLPIRELPRRPGDAPHLVARCTRARTELDYQITDNSLEWIIQTAYDWELKLRKIKGHA